MGNDSLDIIAREINLLKEKKSLDYADTKRLEILIKMQRLIHNTPTEIIQIDEDIYTDGEVLRAIKKKVVKKRKPAVKKKPVKKKAPIKKKAPTKKTKVSNGTKKKADPRATSGS